MERARSAARVQERYDTANAHLLTALELIEGHVERPMKRRALAQAAGISVRQLERLFAHHLDTTLDGHYREVQLERARTLLRQTANAGGGSGLGERLSKR